MSRGRLSRRLATLTSVGIGAIWLLAVFSTALVLKYEQEELLDLHLQESAELFLPVLTERWRNRESGIEPRSDSHYNPEEALVYLLVDRSGRIVLQSPSVADADLPALPMRHGYLSTATHVFYATEFNREGFSVVYGDPKVERRDAYMESFVAFLLPILALLPIAYFIVGWVARAGLEPLNRLRDEIAERGEGQLDPIDARGQPEELAAITAKINGLMVRLGQALAGERAFATNAAHELRTPVAVALAQVQRLKIEAEGVDPERIERIEAALQKMSRLVARLLELARSDAGLGVSAEQHDLKKLLGHVLEDSLRDPARAERLKISLPDQTVPAPIDPDAFAILAGNLIDNAFQHSPAGTDVSVALSRDGSLRVTNDAPRLEDRELSGLTRRLYRARNSGGGFGLGLHIADAISRQSGGKLTLRSPVPGRDSGFEAVFKAPGA